MSSKLAAALGLQGRARRRLFRSAAVFADTPVWEILDIVPEPAIVTDGSGVVVGANDKAEHVLGYPPGTLRGTAVDALFPIEEAGGPVSLWQRRRPNHEIVGRRSDGTVFTAELSLSAVKAADETYVIAIIRDVSEHRRTDALRTTEANTLGRIAAGASLEEVLATLARGIEAMTPGMYVSILLADPEGDWLTHCVAPSLPQDYVAAVAQVPIGPAVGSCGTAAHRKDLVVVADIATDPLWEQWRSIALEHALRACWSSPILAPDGALLGTFACYYAEPRSPTKGDLDVVSRATHLAGIALQRHREEQLRYETEGRYRVLSELTSDFAYAFSYAPDGSAKVEWVTDAFSRITGYSVEEWEKTGAWRGLVHPDDLLSFEQRGPRLMRGEEVISDVRILTKSGDVRWLSVYSRPVIDDSGRLVGVVGAAQDFTTRKEAEDAKTMFLATASHELKTPLTVIQGFAQLVGARGARGDGMPEAIEMEAADAIERRAVQLNRIVDRILLSSRIEAGQTKVNLVAVEVKPILEERVAAIRASMKRDVVFDAPDLPVVQADHDAIVTIVDHLLENAMKYSPDGGPIEVSVGPVSGGIAVEIRDRGIGMTREQMDRCFEKFWQAEQSDVRRFGGTGIGLFIVRSLTEAMGGSVGVESKPGEGTAFTFTLREVGAPKKPENEPGLVGERTSIREFMRHIGVPGKE